MKCALQVRKAPRKARYPAAKVDDAYERSHGLKKAWLFRVRRGPGSGDDLVRGGKVGRRTWFGGGAPGLGAADLRVRTGLGARPRGGGPASVGQDLIARGALQGGFCSVALQGWLAVHADGEHRSKKSPWFEGSAGPTPRRPLDRRSSDPPHKRRKALRLRLRRPSGERPKERARDHFRLRSGAFCVKCALPLPRRVRDVSLL